MHSIRSDLDLHWKSLNQSIKSECITMRLTTPTKKSPHKIVTIITIKRSISIVIGLVACITFFFLFPPCSLSIQLIKKITVIGTCVSFGFCIRVYVSLYISLQANRKKNALFSINNHNLLVFHFFYSSVPVWFRMYRFFFLLSILSNYVSNHAHFP